MERKSVFTQERGEEKEKPQPPDLFQRTDFVRLHLFRNWQPLNISRAANQKKKVYTDRGARAAWIFLYTAAFTRRQRHGTLKQEAQKRREGLLCNPRTCTPGSKREQGRGKRLAPHHALTSLSLALPKLIHRRPILVRRGGQTPRSLQNAIKNI
jgi:hypothetical protein